MPCYIHIHITVTVASGLESECHAMKTHAAPSLCIAYALHMHTVVHEDSHSAKSRLVRMPAAAERMCISIYTYIHMEIHVHTHIRIHAHACLSQRRQ